MFKNIKKYMQKTREINIKCSRCKKDITIDKGKFAKKDGIENHNLIIKCDNCGKKIDISNMFGEVALDIDSSTYDNCSNIEGLGIATNLDNRNRYDKYKDINHKDRYNTSDYRKYKASYPKPDYSKSNTSFSSNSSYIEKVVYKPILTNTSDVAISNTKPFNLFNSCEKNKNFNNAIDIDKAYRMSKKLNNSLMQSYCIINCVVCGKECKLHEINKDCVCRECSRIENINFTTTTTTQTEYNTKTYKDENGNEYTLKQEIIKEVKIDGMDVIRNVTTESSYKIRGKYKNMFDYYKNKAKNDNYTDDNIVDNEYYEDSNNHNNNEVPDKEISDIKIINVTCECCGKEFKDVKGLKHYICSICAKKEEFEKDVKEDEQSVAKEIKEDTIIIKKEMQNDEILSAKITNKESGNRKEIVNVICSCCGIEFKDLKGLKMYICSKCAQENTSKKDVEAIEDKIIELSESDVNQELLDNIAYYENLDEELLDEEIEGFKKDDEMKTIEFIEDFEEKLIEKDEIMQEENSALDEVIAQELEEEQIKQNEENIKKIEEELIEEIKIETIYVCSVCGRESLSEICKHCYM